MRAGIDTEFISDLFTGFSAVSVRRMFGGAGIFADGTMFALVSDGVIYLKAGAANVPAFEREGCGPFSYQTKDGTRALTTYWRMPERLYDDPDELAGWAREALAAARAGAAKRKPAPSKPAGMKRKR